MTLQDCVNQMEWGRSVLARGAPLGMRGVEGSQGGEEESGAGQVPADISHPARIQVVLLSILSSLYQGCYSLGVPQRL